MTARTRLRTRVRFAGWSALTALALGIVAFLTWTQLVMPADRAAAQAVFDNPAVTVTDTDVSVVIAPAAERSMAGLVFIPGAKVDPYAYLATLSPTVAATGMTVVITKPVLNLAFFDQRPLDTFTATAPDVASWFIGGHSLGGVRACMYAQDNEVAGLVLLGSYCASAVDEEQSVLSISGSEDGLSTPATIDDAADLLPADTTFVRIEGANHASFGAYGAQPGDGEATLTPAQSEQAITGALSTFTALRAPQSE
ncbi:alpha/beta hydrolase [Cryobacterium adonitolivorans]|uniref:Alpha/beta hydrolase n=1 Tax=Cryobacterium adonitolivorans TaxID=1259189 RepID=A0A4R8W2R0_9MICO|nr:alpha/beta hydrolase [Cryobacterium adonitolivorans]TFC01115.1 alpha/beta hydrolase [Cryobacterium adonitolivorans]